MDTNEFFGNEKISKILFKLAPPVMLAQLIQALYNIVDSLYIGRYGSSGLTALSIICPIQLLMIAIAVGTGVGVNTIMAAKLGSGNEKESKEYAGIGTPLEIILWFIFSAVCFFIMPYYARMSTSSPEVIRDVTIYGRIVCIFSFGLFLESMWSKILQANGDMKTPMYAQIIGAVTNIILDPLLIFGMFFFPEMGIAGAATATVAGQIAAAIVVMKKGFQKMPEKNKFIPYTKKTFAAGMPNILMQSAYTLYILGLNLILSRFSDQAVTALGLYYKWQTLFLIPFEAMQACIVPIISFNYAAKNIFRCRKIISLSVIFEVTFMAVGAMCFWLIPGQMLAVFTKDREVISIGSYGLRIIAISFFPMVTSLTFPVFFQAVGCAFKSSLLTVIRTMILFVPLGYVFSKFGLKSFWLTFPITEILTTSVGLVFYKSFIKAHLRS